MAKRVFFSFHYQDVIDFRANVVRNHWRTKLNRESSGYFDASVWESARKTGEESLKRLINNALKNTSVTCVLIGTETHARPWVRYEIMKSLRMGKWICGVHINSIKGKDGRVKTLGKNPFEDLMISYSTRGQMAQLQERSGSGWRTFDKIERGNVFPVAQVPRKFHGRRVQLSELFPVYDWGQNDGYNKFPSWID